MEGGQREHRVAASVPAGSCCRHMYMVAQYFLRRQMHLKKTTGHPHHLTHTDFRGVTVKTDPLFFFFFCRRLDRLGDVSVATCQLAQVKRILGRSRCRHHSGKWVRIGPCILYVDDSKRNVRGLSLI